MPLARPKRFAVIAWSISSLLATTMGASETVRLKTADGLEIAGSLWRSAPARGGVLLLHPCDGDRRSMDRFTVPLHDAGYTVLSFDFRGLGESLSPDLDLSRASRGADWERAAQGFPRDARAALAHLRAQVGTEVPIAVVAASCGGHVALELAAETRLAALALVSVRLDGDGLSRLRQIAPSLPCFATAAEADPRAAATARAIAEAETSGSASRLLPGSTHAGALLDTYPRLVAEITTWVAGHLDRAATERSP